MARSQLRVSGRYLDMTIYDLLQRGTIRRAGADGAIPTALAGRFRELVEARAGRVGHFTDVTDTLLPLFNDLDGRGSRRWREMFGLERPLPRRIAARLSCREALRSSSGW